MPQLVAALLMLQVPAPTTAANRNPPNEGLARRQVQLTFSEYMKSVGNHSGLIVNFMTHKPQLTNPTTGTLTSVEWTFGEANKEGRLPPEKWSGMGVTTVQYQGGAFKWTEWHLVKKDGKSIPAAKQVKHFNTLPIKSSSSRPPAGNLQE